MRDTRYCLQCERPVEVEIGSRVVGHLMWSNYPDNFELDFCEGPFVYSEPPAPLTEREWQDVFASEPDREELAEMDADASYFFVVAE